MERYYPVAIVTLLCSLMIFGMSLTVTDPIAPEMHMANHQRIAMFHATL